MSSIINTVLLMQKNGTETAITESFNAVIFTKFNNITRDKVTALSGKMYEYTLAKRREWDIVISANELFGSSNEKLGWLENFWIADQRFLRTDTTATEVIEEMTFTKVVTADGRSPREQIAGNKHLSQFKLTLIEALR